MSENILNVTDSNFDEMVLKADTPVLVDYWASWCAPCRAIAPVVEEVSNEYEGKIRVAKMNVDENPSTPGRYGVRGIPTLILFKDIKDYQIMRKTELEYYQKYAPRLVEEPPASTILEAASLARPEFLIEVDVIAVVSRK